ncbi:hypothetical protein DSO57_1020518 [Entomophthora muscae]|uniref:Uncharacterized protein n=1 Tax=Entomophthora muscae TaxID=34485 RepID=A0ACC2S5P9_9FUNG|nr:hypothetical protein DSO57_1020518 [Entomophthora muscae]
MRRNPQLPVYMYLPSIHLLPSHLKTQAPGCVSAFNTALTLKLADPKVHPPANPRLDSTDPDASPLLCYPDSQEIEKDQLHRVLAVNALTQSQRVRKKPLIAPEAQNTVALSYAEQLTLSYTKVIHESDSAKRMSQLLKSVHVSASLETLKGIGPTLSTVLESFFSNYKDMDVYIAIFLGTDAGDKKYYTYINMLLHKVKVRAIIDSGAPGNIVSSRLVKKLKLVPDLD